MSPHLSVQLGILCKNLFLNYFAAIKKPRAKLLKYFIFSFYSFIVPMKLYILYKVMYIRGTCIYVCICVCVYINIYTYMYIYSELIRKEISKMASKSTMCQAYVLHF